MYNLLTRMPLLQGINGMELARLEEQARMQIEHLAPSKLPLISQGQPCRELIFLVAGTMTRQTVSSDGTYIMTESISGPAVIEADKLFGLDCEFGSTYLIPSECQVMRIDKAAVVSHLLRNDIFRTNYVNMMAAELHRQQQSRRFHKKLNAEEKVARFISVQFSPTPGQKTLQIKMRDLAEYVGETRLTVSNILNEWNQSGRIKLRRKEIIIDDLSKLNIQT